MPIMQLEKISKNNLTIKVDHSAKWREWNCGKKRTERRLPCYLNKDFYIPKFNEMTLEAFNLLKDTNE